MTFISNISTRRKRILKERAEIKAWLKIAVHACVDKCFLHKIYCPENIAWLRKKGFKVEERDWKYCVISWSEEE